MRSLQATQGGSKPLPPEAWEYPQVRRPTRLDRASIDEVLAAARQLELGGSEDRDRRGINGARRILEALAGFDGDTWAERWSALEAAAPEQASWLKIVQPEPRKRTTAMPGIWVLCGLDVLRPSFGWFLAQKIRNARCREWVAARSSEESATFEAELHSLDFSTAYIGITRQTLARLMACTGAPLSQLTADDLIGYNVVREREDVESASGIQVVWRVLRNVGWLDHESEAMPFKARFKRGQKTAEELVDQHGIAEPHRGVFVEYFKARRPEVTYSTWVSVASKLLNTYWNRVTNLEPDLPDFKVSRTVIDRWSADLRGDSGTARADYDSVLFTVRAFYEDVAKWAADDAYWVQWATRSPISRADTGQAARRRRLQTSFSHQRTRELSPHTPRLVAQAHADLERGRTMLADTQAAQLGDDVVVDGQPWRLARKDARSPLRLVREGCRPIFPVVEEDRSFWAWASLEVLRHSGVRIEEMLELTHMAIQQHRVAKTGEVVPLVHIVPSKTDNERLLVANPELMHALSEIIRRVRDENGVVPLTRRWDRLDRTLGAPLPNLFVRRTKQNYNQLHVISDSLVRAWLNRLAERAGLTSNGRPVYFTPHDFRRLFATDALASGLPPHIVQILMGHKSIATTQGYAAIYPHDVIRAHRTFIDLRRTLRPGEEYREPTPEEWDQFEDHFVQRRVSLGSCSRAWGTGCQHEHACVRCSLLRPDPEQADRLRDIVRNLGLRIKEAQNHHWQGEVDGLTSTLQAAEAKLAQMERAAGIGRVDLGMPSRTTREVRPPRSTRERQVASPGEEDRS